MRLRAAIFGLAIAASGLASAWAEPTQVTVRAFADDAKFIGTSMGGVRITLTDAKTGKLLAQGLTEGATGDTRRIVREPRARGQGVASADTAAFRATLDISAPTLVKAEGYGPVGKPDSAITVSAMRWVLPGEDIAGDGWVLAFPGLVAEPTWSLTADGVLNVSAKVTMMCGCPIEPAGDWNADDYRVQARLSAGRRQVAESALSFAGQPSQFHGAIGPVPPGRYVLQVIASNAKTGNNAVVERQVVVPRAK